MKKTFRTLTKVDLKSNFFKKVFFGCELVEAGFSVGNDSTFFSFWPFGKE